MLSETERRSARGVGERLARELGIDAARRAYDAHRLRNEAAPWPVLHIDDVSGIPFLDDVVGVAFYQLRARVRAGDGDLFAATCPNLPDYERYNSERLGLGSPTFLHAPPVGAPIAVTAALQASASFATLCQRAQAAGGLTIHPYMAIEPVWALAAAVADRTGCPVQVLGPPPPVTWWANDKVRLTDLADGLADRTGSPRFTVETYRGRSAVELLAQLDDLAERHTTVALKMARCASAMGNAILQAAEWRQSSRPDRLATVEAFLEDKQWAEGSEVLAVAWENATSSPSSQLWLPVEGAPRIDGLYEQLLVGPEQVFLGSIPSRLDARIEAEMSRISLLMATAYQHLGYVGRCSFDFIVVDGRPILVECNGRWGGTSTPMALLDRLFPDGRPAYRARDYVHAPLKGQPFAALEHLLGDALYDHRTGRGHLIAYNVGCLQPYGKFDVIAFAADLPAATRLLEEDLPRLLGA